MTIQIPALSEEEMKNTENLVWTFQDELKRISEDNESVSVIPLRARKRLYDVGIIFQSYRGGKVTLTELGSMLLNASYEAEPEASLFEFAGIDFQTVPEEKLQRAGEPIIFEPTESWNSRDDEKLEDPESVCSENEVRRKRDPRPSSVAEKIPRERLKQLIDKELSVEEIAEELDVSRRSLRRYAKKYDLKLPKKSSKREKSENNISNRKKTHQNVVSNDSIIPGDPGCLKLEELIENYNAYAELYTFYCQEIQRRLSLLQEVA